jgi:hypothetical protein
MGGDIVWSGVLTPWTPWTSLFQSYIRRRSIYLGVHFVIDAELPKIAGLPCLKNLSTGKWVFPGELLKLPGLARLRCSPAEGDQSTCEWIFPEVVLKLPRLSRLR